MSAALRTIKFAAQNEYRCSNVISRVLSLNCQEYALEISPLSRRAFILLRDKFWHILRLDRVHTGQRLYEFFGHRIFSQTALRDTDLKLVAYGKRERLHSIFHHQVLEKCPRRRHFQQGLLQILVVLPCRVYAALEFSTSKTNSEKSVGAMWKLAYTRLDVSTVGVLKSSVLGVTVSRGDGRRWVYYDNTFQQCCLDAQVPATPFSSPWLVQRTARPRLGGQFSFLYVRRGRLLRLG